MRYFKYIFVKNRIYLKGVDFVITFCYFYLWKMLCAKYTLPFIPLKEMMFTKYINK